MSDKGRTNLTILLTPFVAVGLFFLILVFVIAPNFFGSRRGDFVFFILEDEQQTLILSEDEFDELIDSLHDFPENYVLVTGFLQHDFWPGDFLPIRHCKFVDPMIGSTGFKLTPARKDHYEQIARTHLAKNPRFLPFNPTKPKQWSVAWVPLGIAIIIYSIYGFICWHITRFITHIDLILRDFFVIQPRLLNNQCLHCGHSCKDITTGICPECGKPHAQTECSNA